MPLSSGLGTHAVSAQLKITGQNLRKRLLSEANELTTGLVDERINHLRGELGALASSESRRRQISGALISTEQTLGLMSGIQSALERISKSNDNLRDALLPLSYTAPSASLLQSIGQTSKVALQDMISTLSTQWTGQALFSGSTTDRAPLPDAKALLDAFVATLPPDAAAADIITAAEGFFDDDTGPFQTMLYAGGPPRHVSADVSGQHAELPTATDPALRTALREATLGALLDSPSAVISPYRKQELAQDLAGRNPETTARLVHLQGRLGGWQAVMSARKEGLLEARDQEEKALGKLIGADPYDAAVRLENTRTKLEALYTVTARVTRLSLVEYLR